MITNLLSNCSLILFSFVSVAFMQVTPSQLQAQTYIPFEGIPEFAKVDEGLYRGGRPELFAVAELKSSVGIKTILTFDDNMDAVAAEKQEAEKVGIHHISIPIDSLSYPDEADINRALSIMTDPSGFPLFVHCKHGQDRTGLVVGLYRFQHDGWTADAAYDEMLNYGFKWYLLGLSSYFHDHTSQQ